MKKKKKHTESEWTNIINSLHIVSKKKKITLGWWWWCRGSSHAMHGLGWLQSFHGPHRTRSLLFSSSRPFCWLSNSPFDQMPRRLQRNGTYFSNSCNALVSLSFSHSARHVRRTWLVYVFFNERLTFDNEYGVFIRTTLHVKIRFIYVFLFNPNNSILFEKSKILIIPYLLL